MRPSPPVLAAASSLAGALVGALLALQLGVVELGGALPVAPAAGVAPAPGPADDVRRQGADARAVPVEEVRERRATVAALGVLRRWDGRRAQAWTRGDPSLLRPLYTAASRAGRRDVALLEQYAERGWSVRGVQPQVVAAEALTRTSDRVEVRVVERYPDLAVDGVTPSVPADGAGPDASEPHVRVVSLVRSPTGWRVERVAAR